MTPTIEVSFYHLQQRTLSGFKKFWLWHGDVCAAILYMYILHSIFVMMHLWGVAVSNL